MSQPPALQAQALALDWLMPWQPLTRERAERCERALPRELTAGHPLAGRVVRAIAARVDCDDVLYWVGDPEELAVVRLRHKPARTLDAVGCMRFTSVAEFVQACLEPDHLEFTEAD